LKVLPNDYSSALTGGRRPFSSTSSTITTKTPVDGQIVQAATKCKRAALKRQLEMSGQTDFLKFPYHRGIIKNEIPLSIGRRIGQERTMMLLLRKAHLGEVTVSVWLKV
jgi:aspartate--ammonia ligase